MHRISSFLLFLSYASAAKVDDSVHYFVTFDTAENGLAGGQLLEEENEKALKDDNSLRISTQNNENYICKLPKPTTTEYKYRSGKACPADHEHMKRVEKLLCRCRRAVEKRKRLEGLLPKKNVEVRLRCKTADHSSLAISLSLAEPNLCQYILTLESERFCEPLQYADDYGLIALETEDESTQKAPGPI
ncbi:hypothetical protein OSTOST_14571 [Ostertagia ostertagi]